MGDDVQKPQAGVGGAHTGGTNPYPGGTIDPAAGDVMPAEGRSSGVNENESTRDRTESVERMLENTASEGEAEVGKDGSGSGGDPA